MIFEFADGGTLREYLGICYHELSWTDKLALALGISSGLKHLHGLGVVHKDLVMYINVPTRALAIKDTFL